MVEVLNVKEVAEMLHVSKQLIYKAAKQGQIPYFKIGDRYLFNKEKIEAMLNGEDPNAVKEEPKQNDNTHRVYGTIRTRRLESARMG